MQAMNARCARDRAADLVSPADVPGRSKIVLRPDLWGVLVNGDLKTKGEQRANAGLDLQPSGFGWCELCPCRRRELWNGRKQ